MIRMKNDHQQNILNSLSLVLSEQQAFSMCKFSLTYEVDVSRATNTQHRLCWLNESPPLSLLSSS